MKWLRLAWGGLLVVVLSTFLLSRHPELRAGHATPADIVVFLVWMALLLSPLFTEVSILGVSVKREIQELRNEVRQEVASIKTAIDVRNTFAPQIFLPAPPPDSQLPMIEEQVRNAVQQALAAQGGVARPQEEAPVLGDAVGLLFHTRYNMERELRRIAKGRDLVRDSLRPYPPMQIARLLEQADLLDSRLVSAIRDVYAITSRGIHAEEVSAAQVNFVREVAPGLLAALRALS